MKLSTNARRHVEGQTYYARTQINKECQNVRKSVKKIFLRSLRTDWTVLIPSTSTAEQQ